MVQGSHSCWRGWEASSQRSSSGPPSSSHHPLAGSEWWIKSGFLRPLIEGMRAVWTGQCGSSTAGEGPRLLGKREQWFTNLTLIWGQAGVHYKSLKIQCCGDASIVYSGTARINLRDFFFSFGEGGSNVLLNLKQISSRFSSDAVKVVGKIHQFGKIHVLFLVTLPCLKLMLKNMKSDSHLTDKRQLSFILAVHFICILLISSVFPWL